MRVAVLAFTALASVAAFATATAAVGLAGCATPDIMGTPLLGQDVDAGLTPSTTKGDAAPSEGGDCVQAPPSDLKIDSLPSCCTDGKAHCVPSTYVPTDVRAALADCSGGYCVPDAILTSKTPPPSCKSLNNADGVCLSLCVPQVAQYKDLLPKVGCADDERCAPCISPLDNKPTGACDINPAALTGGGGGTCGGADAAAPPTTRDAGPTPEAGAPQCPHQGPPVLDVTQLPACGDGAHCIATALVPKEDVARLAQCPSDAAKLCVPDTLIASGGQFILPTCVSIAGAEGRCANVVLPDVAAQKDLLPQSTCKAFERCAPCYSPVDGTDTGACRQSCDPGPTKPKVVFSSCCKEQGSDRGKCVPKSAIPKNEADQLSNDNCSASSDLCVPTELLGAGFKPPTCSASGFLIGDYTGVCLSNCLDFGLQGIALDQGSCDDLHTCVPCIDPTSGKPTGAPGCAP